jgi:hypothetical protein
MDSLLTLCLSPVVYILGRNLERPFKAPMMNMEENTPVEENVETPKKSKDIEDKSDESSAKDGATEIGTSAGDDEVESSDEDSDDDEEDEQSE